jgi:hypothetical protein
VSGHSPDEETPSLDSYLALAFRIPPHPLARQIRGRVCRAGSQFTVPAKEAYTLGTFRLHLLISERHKTNARGA